MRRLALAAALAALFTTLPGAHAFDTLDGSRPLVIGHRGASGYLPEHTLAAYTLAIEMGADYIEPDLVATKDGVLIARHEPMLGSTTDVASRPEFAALRTTKMLDGVATTDWFASDFTLAEIRTLRAIQPIASRDQSFNGLHAIPTLQEVIDLAKSMSATSGRTIGIYPETKHPTFHRDLGLPLEDTLLATLSAAGWNSASAPVFIQSFEVSNLKDLNGRTDIRLVQLIDADDVKADGSLSLVAPYAQPYDFVVAGDSRTFADLLTAEGLQEIATYADGIGPWKPYLLKTVIFDPDGDGVADDRDGNGVVDGRDRVVIGDTGVIGLAHAEGLVVHPYTFRDDRGIYGYPTGEEEMVAMFRLGADGLFTDHPDVGAAAVAAVPEPGTWALMVGGLGLIGVLARRRAGGMAPAGC
jgi:glycerophosphoryl diester phosphodiesterase